MTRYCKAILLLGCICCLLTPAAAQSPPVAPREIGGVTISGSLRTRVESWDWFSGNADSSYTYPGSILRLSLAESKKKFDWQLEFALPFLLVDRFAPLWAFLILGPFLLKVTFAWRALEEHALAVEAAVQEDIGKGRAAAGMMVSRDTGALTPEEILSAACESLSENLVDSIAAPFLFFAAFSPFGLGLAAAAFYRASNTMDAMLGYRDQRGRIGWFPARLDDILTWVPARVTGLLLLAYFAAIGRFGPALAGLRKDAGKRPGLNGGIPMAIIAGGTGVRFQKPGVYTMGPGEKGLAEGTGEIVRTVRAVTLLLSAILITALFLWA